MSYSVNETGFAPPLAAQPPTPDVGEHNIAIEPNSQSSNVSTSRASSQSEAQTAVNPAPTSTDQSLSHDIEAGTKPELTRTPSCWGEDIHVGQPMDKNDPAFHELQRSLTGSRHSEEPWSLAKHLEGALASRRDDGIKQKKLDVAWKNLAVRGVGASAVYAETMGSMFNPMLKIQDKKQAKAAEAANQSNENLENAPSTLKTNEKFLIRNFNGVLKSGEMAFVIGRPGSGCTTFLKAVTNIRNGYAGVDGDVLVGSMDHKEAEKYSGNIVFNAEDDTHYPTLTVGQTLKFGLKMKTPTNRPEGQTREQYEQELLSALLKTLGIEHTHDTLVGNEFVRGVSGGERKRVSIAEVLVNRASVVAWDNSSRGLDASTALEYTRSIRTITDLLGSTSFISLYQAGNQIYELFDKVMVIAAGQCIYWGPRAAAKPYFENLGFKCPQGQNVADYLTGVTVKTERMLFDKDRRDVPQTVDDFVAAYLASDIYKQSEKELEDHLRDTERLNGMTEEFKLAVQEEKSASAGKNSLYSTGLWTQVKACTIRQYQLMWNDKGSIAIKQGSCIIQSIILGSLFYNLPQTTAGLFTRGGSLFFILLFNALLGMTEVTTSFTGRTILAKHKSFAMYRPSAVVLAQVLADFPILIAQVSAFLLPIYFMCQLRQSASAFFTLWIITYVTTLALLGFFRAIGFNFSTFDGASQVSGLAVGLLIIYTGYLIPQTSMKPWLSWVRWINPLYYGFESAMVNEFHDTQFDCVGTTLVPFYGVDGHFACTVQGSQTGEDFVTGDAYLQAGLNYRYSHLWRNVGIVIGLWVFFVAITAWGVERLKAQGSERSYLLYKRQKNKKDDPIARKAAAVDEEKGPAGAIEDGKTTRGNGTAEDTITKTTTVLTWDELNYTVPVPGGHRQLLSGVQGYTKPGTLTALMGASGAGKTTLLDVLALRKEEGVVEGHINVDGRPLGASFQRTTGYVSQVDIHEPTQTVREALEFSALLRQPASVSREEKLAYVDKVLDLLELTDIEHAIIGNNNVGLGVEQRKRLTIGVELVAKPVLLFLDEPTSGLDGQSSFNILRFLRKLADAGQSMLVTIHQPSALLFDQFDRLLLLARGGHTVYFGDLGDNASEMKAYFARQGIECPEDANPAEFMIDVVSGSLSKGRDWGKVWLESDEYKNVSKEVADLKQECASKPPSFEEDGREYAASASFQYKTLIHRATVAMWRSPDYVISKIMLHVGSALLNSLSFLQLDNSVISLQNRLFSVFQAMFVAPGVFQQVQPRFIDARMLFEAREKPSKIYSWQPFVVAQIIAEIPWVIVSSTLFYVLWYFVVFPVGISTDAQHAGPMYAILILYQFWSIGFAYAVAASVANAEQAALVNPIFLGIFASFSGVLVPYAQITAFWRYWLYYLNPWTYILGAQTFFAMRNIPVVCKDSEYAVFSPPSGQTCENYLATFFESAPGYIKDPTSTTSCEVCAYSSGNDYLANVNLSNSTDGGRDIGITVIYVVFFFILVYLFMWLRSRPKRKAKLE
ncbi:abc transporter [Phaffia rhodozyma]|uniref:Abc transporter n=1 Tax=Phaffia rhodozyma TaxID=264483 RepID=A0A0F7SPL0_PHARH|nr:abc transporter [Phaffia rhodozyma]